MKWYLKFWSLALVLAMLCNVLPAASFAQGLQEIPSADAEATVQPQAAERAEVIAELTEKRTQYTKEFLLSNGLHMATVYAEPVHYEKDGSWAEIDNTLKIAKDGTVTNTAGVWNVSFPEQLQGGNVIIEKDGCTLSFSMEGELRSSGELMAAAMGTETAEQYAVGQLQTASAAITQTDKTSLRASYEYAQAAPEKLYSQLRYNRIYADTDVIYDLQSNTVKESIVMASYNSTLRGYRYTLQVENMEPILEEDGQITFYAKDDIVMVMPAPYLLDANSEFSDDIQVQLTGSNGTYTLTYLLPRQWLAAQDRAWPVILDPVVNASRQKANIQDRTVCSVTDALSYTKTVLNAGRSTKNGIMRSYVKFNDLPFLTSSDVIVEATFKLHKVEDSTTSQTVEVHKVTGDWNETDITWATQPTFDAEITDFKQVKNGCWYLWRVTDIVRSWYTDENNGLMIKTSDNVENGTSQNFRQFYSSNTGSAHRPILQIIFRNNNGLESYWDYTSTSAGRAGVGYVNNFTGNMVWVRSDMGFSGSQRPVNITHVYNANDAIVPNDKQYTEGDPNNATPEVESNNSNDSGGNYFGLGIGWRTNYHQRVFQWACSDASNASDYYVWEDEDGTDHYFKKVSSVKYRDEDNLNLTLHIDDDGYRIVDKQDNTLYFDSLGRLTRNENNQKTKSYIEIEYNSENPVFIDTITDGVGRKYEFHYTDGLLDYIRCMVESDNLYEVRFEYTDSMLTEIIDNYCNDHTEGCDPCRKNETNKHITYTYNDDGIMTSATDIDGYKVSYTYTRERTTQSAGEATASTNSNELDWEPPYYVESIQTEDTGESGAITGGSLHFTYGYNETVMTDHKGNKQIIHFNDYGNVTGVMDDEGHARYADYAANGHADTGKANQLAFSSKLQNTVANHLRYGGFETGNDWRKISSPSNSASSAVSLTTEQAHTGSYSLKLTVASPSASNAAYSPDVVLAPGETITFSYYVLMTANTGSAKLYRRISGGSSYIKEIPLRSSDQWQRVQITYTNDTGETAYMRISFFAREIGTYYIDTAQAEKSAGASRYNLVENGDFRYNSAWTENSSCTDNDGYVTATGIEPAAPQLDGSYYKIIGDSTKTKTVSQTVQVSGEAGDSFVLTGWAKGYSAPLDSSQVYTRHFAVRARFHYADNTNSDYFYATFNATTRQWQYAATQMVAKKDYSSIIVELIYQNNVNTVYFDGIQLYKEEFGSSYTYDEDGNPISVVDLQKKNTTYEYNSSGDLTKILEDNKAKVTYTYDDYHNITKAVTEEGLTYNFEYDDYGNNTKVSIGSGNTTISSSAEYTADGNFQISSTDALGKTTFYGYNEDTGVLEWAQYPEDSESTRTEYTYDSMYRAASAVCETSSNLSLSADYTYEGDYLTTIETPSTTYHFEYGYFGLQKSVSVGDQALATYSYTPDQNRYLQQLTYGNGDFVRYTYEEQTGRLLTETYEDGTTVTYAYNNDGDLATVTDSATGRTITHHYDLLGRPMKSVESGTGYTHSVEYRYNTENNLEKLIENINGTEHITTYTYDGDNRVTSVTTDGTTVEYTYDALGRLTQQVTKNGDTVLLTEAFTYTVLPNDETGTENTEESETVVTQTSSQIATYTTTVGSESVTYSYTYDGNGNILTVTSGGKTTTYEYDSANQLIRENNEAADYTHTWTYDNAGNLLQRKEYDYTDGSLTNVTAADSVSYGYPAVTDPENNTVWGDKLTSYDDKAITYDQIGNPLSFGNRTYSWEHGRQLKSLTEGDTTWNYTYNSGGMRTGRTDGTTTYQYIYSGSQLVQMKVGSNTLNFTYDAAGVPLTVTYNGTKYYYTTNVQGDVVAILDSSGTQVASYTYDAWGNCLTAPTSGVGLHNPLRYRGYVYDRETELYYLQSRYYDPKVGRFLNADGFTTTGQGFVGNNMFAYCGNNPVNCADPSGRFFKELLYFVYESILSVVAEIFGSSQSTGSAQPYISMPGSNDPNSPNCYSFSTDSPTNEQPGARSGRTVTNAADVYDVGKSVEADLHTRGFTVRQISGPHGKILENEYRIALRVGTRPYESGYVLGSNGKVYKYAKYDYHFMKQTDTGYWAEKHGISGASILWDDPTMTPDTIPWTLAGVPYYDSDIIYYAIGRL